MSTPRPLRSSGLAGLFLSALLACNPDTPDEVPNEASAVLAFEEGPPVETVKDLPDPLWARELSRLPKTAQQVVLVNPEKLEAALASGPLRDRLENAVAGLGGPLVLSLIDGLVDELDASRPIAIAAFAYPEPRLFAEARFGAVVDPDLVPPFLQSRVLVPTRDPRGLLASLDLLWSAIGLVNAEPPPALRPSLGEAGRLLVLPSETRRPSLYVIVLPEDLGIRAEVLYGDLRPGPRLDAAMVRVAAQPREDNWEETPAVRHLLVQRPLLGTLAAPEGSAALGFSFALMEADQAVRSTGSELTPVSWARGLSIAVASMSILDPRDRIYADSALTLDLSEAFDLRTTTTLTPAGAAIADKALSASGHVFPAKSEQPSLLLRSGESMRASTAAAEPLRFGRQSSDDLLAERWSWTGTVTSHTALSSSRWPMLRTLTRVFDPAEFDVAAILPDAYTIVVEAEDEGANEPAIAVALDYEPSVDTGPVKTAIEGLDWPDGARPSVSTMQLHGRKLVLVGIGGEVESMIDLEQPMRRGPVERVQLNPKAGRGGPLLPEAWASWFESIGPSWAAWSDAVGRADFVQVHHGASLVGHGLISLEGGATPAAALRSFSMAAPEPTVVVESGRGFECLRDIPHVSLDALDQFASRYSTPASRVASRLGDESPDWSVLAAMVDGEDESADVLRQRSIEAIEATWTTIEGLLECGAADPKSEPMARRVRASWLTELANWADGIPAPDHAKRWAREACDLGSMRGCDRLEAIKKRTSVAIPVAPWLSFPLMGHAGLELVIGRRDMHLDGRPVGGTDTLAGAVERRLAEHHLLGRHVAVFADAGVDYDRLSEAVMTLATFDLQPKLVLRDPAGRLMALPAQSPAQLADIVGDDPRPTNLRFGKAIPPRLPRTPEELFQGFELSAPHTARWGELAHWLQGFGVLPAGAAEAQRARHQAVGSAAAVPSLVLSRP